MSKEFLLSIINTLDVHFFPSVEKEIERKLQAKKNPTHKIEEKIVIEPHMLELLRKFEAFRIGKPNPRALAGIKTQSRKRTR